MENGIIVYWTDGLNPPRRLDISELVGELVPAVDTPEDAPVVSVLADFVFVSWQTVPRATLYNVYIDGVQINPQPVDGITYQIEGGILPDDNYLVQITGLAGNSESEKSPSTAFTIDFVPNNFAGSGSAETLSFTWDAVTDAEGYNIYVDGEKFNENLIVGTEFSALATAGDYTAIIRSVTTIDGEEYIGAASQEIQITVTESITPPSNFAVNVVEASEGSFITNGVDQRAELSNFATYGDGLLNFTYESYIKTTTTGVQLLSGVFNTASDTMFFARINQNHSGSDPGNVRFLLRDEAGLSRFITCTSNPGINDGLWHRVGFSNSNNSFKIYIDGVSVPVSVSSIGSSPINYADFLFPMNIGCGNGGGTLREFYVGQQSDVRFWSDVRTDQEISDNWNKRLVGNETGLFAYYRLDEKAGDAVVDSAGNKDGVLFNNVADNMWDQDDSPFGTYNNAEFSWDAVAGVDGYNVYLSDDEGATYIKQNAALITELTFTIEDIASGNYQAYVTAVQGVIESGPSNVVLFSAGIHYTDFSEYADDTFPAGWKDIWTNSVSHHWLVRLGQGPEWEGNALLEHNQADNEYDSVIWNELGQFTDFELLTFMNPYNNGIIFAGYQGGVVFRCSDTDNNNKNSYVLVFRRRASAADIIVLQKWVNNTIAGIAGSTADGAVDPLQDAIYGVRILVEGDRIRIRVWLQSDPEPGVWHIDVTDPDIASGYIGFTSSEGGSGSLGLWDADSIEIKEL